MTSDRVQEQKLHTEHDAGHAHRDVDTIEHLNDANMHGDDDNKSQSELSTVSYLVNAYMSGISSSNRAILYFILITFISYNYPMQSSSSFIADAKNPLNQYFVKFTWGWTFSAVFLFMVLSNYITTGTWVSSKTFMSSYRLVVGTAVWYIFARIIFPYIEEATGVCGVSQFVTKKTCYTAGHFWRGFDASGHCFLLSWNNLFMVEESQGFFKQRKNTEVSESGEEKHQEHCLAAYLEYLSYGLALLLVLGDQK